MNPRLCLLAVFALAACTQEAVPPPAPAAEPYTPPAIAPAPVDENGLSPLNPPPSTQEAPREKTPLESATQEDNLQAFIAELAGREPTENLLRHALFSNARHIVTWLCDTKGMRLTELDTAPWCAAPGPDSADFPFPELDAEAIAGLPLLFKACPTAAKDDALMGLCIRNYCIYQYPRALRYVLNKGANPNGRDAEGHTPLDYAHYYGWKEGIRLLLAKGATAHTPGRSFAQKEELYIKHTCPKRPGFVTDAQGIPRPVITSPFYIMNDPGPDSAEGGIICRECGATE